MSRKALFLLDAPPAIAAARIYHYTTSPTICQAKVRKKLHKNKSRNLCNLTIAIRCKMWYHYKCQGEVAARLTKKILKKTIDKNKKVCYNKYTKKRKAQKNK